MVSAVSERFLTTIQGEPAVVLEQMPDSWQRIAAGDWMSEPKVYTSNSEFKSVTDATDKCLRY